MRPSVSNWMSSTAVHFKRGKAAGSPHSRKKKRPFSCRFHPRRMRQPYGPQKRSSRITWSQQTAAGTPYHMNTSAGRLISGQQRNVWRFFSITRGSRPMRGLLIPRILSMYRSTCRKPTGVTLIIMKKAFSSGRKISVRQQGPSSVPSFTHTGPHSRDIKAARP